MEEEDLVRETKEKLEDISEHANWNKFLAITTALIAVVAAIASLLSGSYSNEAVLRKNDAILLQSKASDQWNYYQAKGIKKNLAETFFQQTNDENLHKAATQYDKEQKNIEKQAKDFEKQAENANRSSEQLLEKHHKESLAVTFFQIAIALSAMSALLMRQSFWFISLIITLIGIFYFSMGLVG